VWFVGMVLKITRLQKSLCCKGFLAFRGSGGESGIRTDGTIPLATQSAH